MIVKNTALLKNSLGNSTLSEEHYLRCVENLFRSIKNGSIGIAFLNCIVSGVDLNHQDEFGMTVLHHAVAVGARNCIRALVIRGDCDYLIQDDFGRYASDIAMEWSRDYAVARLLSIRQAKQARERGVLPFKMDQR